MRALLAIVALAFVSPASAQPGNDDPGLMAWMQSANAAQETRLEQLAARGDARSLLMAMQLVHPMFPLREDPEREIAAEQARAWSLLERAAQADPEDPVVAWKLATCPADAGLSACGSPASRERLEAVAGDRAAVRLWLAQVAQAIGDDAAVEQQLQAAAEAPVYGAFENEVSDLTWSAWEGIEFPTADPEIGRSYARHVEVDPDAFVEQMVAMSVIARIAAQAPANYSFPTTQCGVSSAEDVVISAPRRRQCLAIFTTMANEDASLLQRIVAEPAMVRLSGEGPGTEAWRDRLRTSLWVYEAGVPLSAQLSSRHDPAYFATWRERGEYQALVHLMQRRGLGLAPPQGWLPENERMRGLLGEGDATSDEAGPAQDGPAPEDPAVDAQPE